MKRVALSLVLLLIGIAAIVAYLTLFAVHQTQQALILQFGQPKRLIAEPGLSYKLPFIQNVLFFDKRLLDLDSAPQEVIASDQKRLVVDAFARWRITNPLLFYQSVNNQDGARRQLSAFLEAALRRVLGAASFEAVVRDERNELMRRITDELNARAEALGITVVDVRIKRADLPEANSIAIFRRMQTERQREAAEIRAEGEEASRRIRADADRQVTVIRADATGESERIRGTGDAEKNRVFANAFGKDPDFFAFYRSMQAYQASLQSGDTRMLLSPDSQFFQYFNDAAGGPGGIIPGAQTPATDEDRVSEVEPGPATGTVSDQDRSVEPDTGEDVRLEREADASDISPLRPSSSP